MCKQILFYCGLMDSDHKCPMIPPNCKYLITPVQPCKRVKNAKTGAASLCAEPENCGYLVEFHKDLQNKCPLDVCQNWLSGVAWKNGDPVPQEAVKELDAEEYDWREEDETKDSISGGMMRALFASLKVEFDREYGPDVGSIEEEEKEEESEGEPQQDIKEQLKNLRKEQQAMKKQLQDLIKEQQNIKAQLEDWKEDQQIITDVLDKMG
jgi:hypothetical protein